MRVIDLMALYALVGIGCAVAVLRLPRGAAGTRRALDAVLLLLAWPLYLPTLLAPQGRAAAGPAAGADLQHEQQRLLQALDAVADPALLKILPSREQVRRLMAHVELLQAKVAELDQVLSSDEFNADRAERLQRDAEAAAAAGTPASPDLTAARHLVRSIERLSSLRRQAAGERDDLLCLCGRLRVQLTLLRFTGSGGERRGANEEDIGPLVAELLGRVEGAAGVLESIS